MDMTKEEFDDATNTLRMCIDDALVDCTKAVDTTNDSKSDINVVTINGQEFKAIGMKAIMKIRLALLEDCESSVIAWENEMESHLAQGHK